MSILTYPLGFIGGGKEFYNNVMENSIKTESIASLDYLERTIPSTADNYTTWTLSWWMKRSSLSASQWIWGTAPGTNHNDFNLNVSDKLYFEWNNTGVSPSAPNSAADVANPDLRLCPPYLFGSKPESNAYFLIIRATLLSDISNTLLDLISEKLIQSFNFVTGQNILLSK